MEIKLASEEDVKQVIDFFDNNLDRSNKAVHSREFFCPFGVKSAVKSGWVIVGVDGNEMISAVRFYPRKTNGVVSVYQFAVDKKYRGNKLVQKMLSITGFERFEFKCPKDIDFNGYYKKIGANINKQNKEFNYWTLVNKKYNM